MEKSVFQMNLDVRGQRDHALCHSVPAVPWEALPAAPTSRCAGVGVCAPRAAGGSVFQMARPFIRLLILENNKVFLLWLSKETKRQKQTALLV